MLSERFFPVCPGQPLGPSGTGPSHPPGWSDQKGERGSKRLLFPGRPLQIITFSPLCPSPPALGVSPALALRGHCVGATVSLAPWLSSLGPKGGNSGAYFPGEECGLRGLEPWRHEAVGCQRVPSAFSSFVFGGPTVSAWWGVGGMVIIQLTVTQTTGGQRQLPRSLSLGRRRGS